MKKNKAFTLIELIVVLVILSIIALIVTPLVLKIVDKADISAKKRSVDEYGHAIELALASYELEHGDYPDSLDKLKIEYSGNEVKCNVAIIRKTGEVYLSECSVQGVKVKDKSTDDGYYQYGRTNREYIDLYGKELEKQIHNYVKKNGVTPSDLSQFNNIYSSDVSCAVKIINNDNNLYISKCKVDGQLVMDESRDSEYYHYGETTAVNALLLKSNDAGITTYTDGNTHEMYTFAHDATEQTEELTDYRYIGNDPYNYVTFNNELWRIIGVFTVEDEDGNKEQRIKIVRNESIGKSAWNSAYSNKWATASLNTYLNGEYYNYLSDEAKAMIGDSKYYLGENCPSSGQSGSIYYTFERGTKVYSGNSTNWIGKIGLMYPSDYAYTYALGVDNKCYTDTYNCHKSTPLSSWLYNNAEQWLISPNSGNSYSAFIVGSGGGVSWSNVTLPYGVYPSISPSTYLISSIQINSGTGMKEDPYMLKQT